MAAEQVTELLRGVESGDASAAARLLPLVYRQLRALAAAKLAREPSGQTLQPTALVHEVWLRLGGASQPDWKNSAHFFSAAAEGMRRILIDHARRKRRLRHGGGLVRAEMHPAQFEIAAPDDGPSLDLLLLDEALAGLARHDVRKAEVVKLRYFAGLSPAETAGVLSISERTAKREWATARIWLFNEIKRLRGDTPAKPR